MIATVLIIYNFCFLVLGTFIYYAIFNSYVRACSALHALRPRRWRLTRAPPRSQGPLPALEKAGINPFWFCMFATVSSFNNVGFALLNDNYTQLGDRPGVLLFMSLLIIAGNTGIPVFLRSIFAIMGYLRPKNRAIRFVLDNPRCVLLRERALRSYSAHACFSRAAAAPRRSSTPSNRLCWR